MQRDDGTLNELWAASIVQQLVVQGVRYFCLSPGSRSCALTLAAAAHPEIETFVHCDERALGFHALGYSKAKREPAAIIVTSGTAVGNLLPAVMEAYVSHIPLIILTADRPPELRDCGANQTADQVKIFSSYTRWQADLPPAEAKLAGTYLSSLLSYAVFKATSSSQGPVHLNCMFREPLHTLSSDVLRQEHIVSPQYFRSTPTSSRNTLEILADKLSGFTSGLILVGSLSCKEEAESILQLGEYMGWPVVSDISGHMRSMATASPHIPYFELVIKNTEIPPVDCVLHFGDRIVSKTIASWLKRQSPEYFLVAEHSDRYDPEGLIRYRIHSGITVFCQGITPFLRPSPSSLLSPLQSLSLQAKEALVDFFSSLDVLTEPGLFYHFSQWFPKEWNLFISNSMPVRDADNLFYPKEFSGHIYLNRGVSGIDGNISTAAGITNALEKPLVAVLGDLAALHDLNAVLQIKKTKAPLILIIINNGGGGIFSFLPVKHKSELFEEFIATAHECYFTDIARFAGLQIYRPETKDNLLELFIELEKEPTACIIELQTDRNQNVEIHNQIHQALRSTLCSAQKLTAQ